MQRTWEVCEWLHKNEQWCKVIATETTNCYSIVATTCNCLSESSDTWSLNLITIAVISLVVIAVTIILSSIIYWWTIADAYASSICNESLARLLTIDELIVYELVLRWCTKRLFTKFALELSITTKSATTGCSTIAITIAAIKCKSASIAESSKLLSKTNGNTNDDEPLHSILTSATIRSSVVTIGRWRRHGTNVND